MPQISTVYTEMRDVLMAVQPDQVAVGTESRVFGALVDVGFEVLFTVVAFADGSTSVYNGNGGGATGIGGVPEVAELNRALLLATESALEAIPEATDTPLPAFGRVRVTALTRDGTRSVDVDGTELLAGHHPLSAAFGVALALMDQSQRLVSQAKGSA